MRFCCQLKISNGMDPDVIALGRKYVNTRCELQSSEGFAQLSSVGMGTEAGKLVACPVCSLLIPIVLGSESRAPPVNWTHWLKCIEIWKKQ